MTKKEKNMLSCFIFILKSKGFTKDEIYERVKKILQPLTSQQYQERVQWVTKKINI